MASPPRSYLFVPGDRPERFAKACASGAHAVIVDLEDAVAPEQKAAARAALAAWLHPDHPVLVRINAADTAWFRDDCALAGRPGVAGVVLPKAERLEDIEALRAAGAAAVLPLIETAVGYDRARELAGAAGVHRLVFGSIDFQLDLGITGEDDALLAFRSGLVLASRLAGVAAPVDGVSTAIDDAAQLSADAARARRLGFGGKLCIHPRQLQAVHAAFSPSEADVRWAKRVLEAAGSAKGVAIAVDGKMVDRPVILRAQAILDEAGQGLPG
ncbi:MULTISPECIES: HpcH/HpaI aldolase/citrate lyase family protein [Ramlibacter]|uniref:CoA ester lyase n=1 Tax=Ramlibacter pinisoli TaxID=2682844 RepID=A0A6N8IWA1_9BURK|nr:MULTISPECIES: CoA ester lyase [Ramlibacter]MBA2960996.1 CoA ester lyase [Ramlibacter sp. CGMCC 1.13660]MVQ30942.1 CoA ester lyase [Ramlibacter pinisoli]